MTTMIGWTIHRRKRVVVRVLRSYQIWLLEHKCFSSILDRSIAFISPADHATPPPTVSNQEQMALVSHVKLVE